MRVCVDTTILIDVLKDEFRQSQEALYSAFASRETLVAPPVVFAELMPQFGGDAGMVAAFLKDHRIDIEPLGLEAVKIAASRWIEYLKRKTRTKCPNCGHRLSLRDHFLSDFYIGGFALATCGAVLTRDRGIFKKYFPDLKGYEEFLKS